MYHNVCAKEKGRRGAVPASSSSCISLTLELKAIPYRITSCSRLQVVVRLLRSRQTSISPISSFVSTTQRAVRNARRQMAVLVSFGCLNYVRPRSDPHARALHFLSLPTG